MSRMQYWKYPRRCFALMSWLFLLLQKSYLKLLSKLALELLFQLDGYVTIILSNIGCADTLILVEIILLLGRTWRRLYSGAYIYAWKYPTRLALWQRACICCRPSWRRRHHCHWTCQRASDCCRTFLWRSSFLGYACSTLCFICLRDYSNKKKHL